MVALNVRRAITAESLVPKLILSDADVLSFTRGVLAGVDNSIIERTLRPFVVLEGLEAGTLEPGRRFVTIGGEWSECSHARKVEVMQRLGRECNRVGKLVPRLIVHVCVGYSTPHDPADKRPLPEREQQVPAIVAIGSTVDGRVIYATKPLVKHDDHFHVCAKTPWTDATVFRPDELPEPDRLMEGFWHGYKSNLPPATG